MNCSVRDDTNEKVVTVSVKVDWVEYKIKLFAITCNMTWNRRIDNRRNKNTSNNTQKKEDVIGTAPIILKMGGDWRPNIFLGLLCKYKVLMIK